MAVQTVIKFGGSLERLVTFPEICEWADVAFRDSGAVIIPGGGRFADEVRACDARWSLDPVTSHWMALLAMDQMGYLLAEKIPSAVPARTEDDIVQAHAARKIPVFLTFAWLCSQKGVPESWEMTSDSISCLFATRIKAPRLVLLKDKIPDEARDGVVEPDGPASKMSEEGWVDGMFPFFLSTFEGEAWMCDGTKAMDFNKHVRCDGARCLRLR